MKIVVGADGSPSSRAAVKWAADLATTKAARVLATHVVPSAWEWEMAALQVNTEPLINARRRDLTVRWTEPLRRADVEYTTRFLEGDPGKELLHLSRREQADLIVIGGTSHGRVHDLVFGGTRHQLVTKAECPVVVVPARRDSRLTKVVEHVHATPADAR